MAWVLKEMYCLVDNRVAALICNILSDRPLCHLDSVYLRATVQKTSGISSRVILASHICLELQSRRD